MKNLISKLSTYRYLIVTLVLTFAIGYGTGSATLGIVALIFLMWLWLHDELKKAPVRDPNEEEGPHNWDDPYDFRY